MSKKMLGFLIGVILFGILMAGATFAFLSADVNLINGLATANKFQVIYDEEKVREIDGPITLGVSKEEGLLGQVGVSMASTSVLSKANLYFDVTNMSTNTLESGGYWNQALIWELYARDANNNLELLDTGNFMECSTTGNKRCVNGDKLYLLKNFQLTYDFQYFDVYVWLDGNIADNGVKGAYFKGTISIETEEFSASLD